MGENEIRKKVREGYAEIAKENLCCCPTVSCCGSPEAHEQLSRQMGYTEEELRSVPQGANLGLGCGNPVALASLREGETVLDLGSGAGLDCFLAAEKVGEKGRVIGVDMTPEMIDKARENAKKANYENVEFRLGEIENLPVADGTADVIISNCVINLSPNKNRAFEEAFRALRPGGRLMVSDLVLLKELPEEVKKRAHPASCVAEAIMRDEYLKAIEKAGFEEVKVVEEKQRSFGDVTSDSNARVVIRNTSCNTQEVKRVSEAEEPVEKIVEEVLNSTASINVFAVKPLE